MLALELNQDNIQKWICGFSSRMENKWNGITTVLLSQIPLIGEQKKEIKMEQTQNSTTNGKS